MLQRGDIDAQKAAIREKMDQIPPTSGGAAGTDAPPWISGGRFAVRRPDSVPGAQQPSAAVDRFLRPDAGEAGGNAGGERRRHRGAGAGGSSLY